MKVAIIDDLEWVVGMMRTVAEKGGHQVINICIGDAPQHPELSEYPVTLFTRDLDRAAELVREFNPDVIFIDHDLNLGLKPENTGQRVVELSVDTTERCVGTSSAFDQSRYCCITAPFDKRRLSEKWSIDLFLQTIDRFG